MNFQSPSLLREAPMFRRETPLPEGNSFIRVAVSQAIGLVQQRAPLEVAHDRFPTDRAVVELLTRAATAPAMTTTTGWAAELVHRVVMDGLKALGPASAAAEIFRRGLVLTYTGNELVSAPGLAAGANFASFVAEGSPIPVRQLATVGALINPHKIATIAVLTREMIEGGNSEALITDALVQSVGACLDTILFDANVEDATRPKGLRNGIAALTASTAADGFEAVFEDISALVDAIAPVAGTGPYIIVGSPGRALGINYRLTEGVGSAFVAIGSSAAGGNLYAIAPAALAVAMSPEPEIESATTATLVMDTAPTDPPMGTHKSMFQTDSTALKVRWPISWVLRDPRGFAWLTPTWK